MFLITLAGGATERLNGRAKLFTALAAMTVLERGLATVEAETAWGVVRQDAVRVYEALRVMFVTEGVGSCRVGCGRNG